MSQPPPPLGRTLARAAGGGAVLGFVAGPVVFGFVGLALNPELSTLAVASLAAIFVAIIAAMYGLVAGVVVALPVVAVARSPRARHAARLIGAIIAPIIVALISTIVFDPALEPGPNQDHEHVREDIGLFYAGPCLAALLAGAVFTPRLLVDPRRQVETESVATAI